VISETHVRSLIAGGDRKESSPMYPLKKPHVVFVVFQVD
jgi:hypothetical protein